MPNYGIGVLQSKTPPARPKAGSLGNSGIHAAVHSGMKKE
jgi:hypothetical protein